jgi:LytR cell envelope-related transcriptional attenuator
MEIIQEIGSYAGFAAVVGLAVLSALYFSQARDVKRLREWAGRAPDREPQATIPPQRVVAQPVPRPPAAVQRPGVPATQATAVRPGVAPATPAAGAPAAAAAAGAAPATASGPAAPAAPPQAPGDTGDQDSEETDAVGAESNGTDEHTVVSQDTVVHPPPAPGAEGEEEDAPDEPGGDGEEGEPGDSQEHDALPEDEDYDDEDDYEDDAPERHWEDTGDEPAVPTPPVAPRRPTIPIGTGGAATPAGQTGRAAPTAASGSGGILPPYEQSRPGGRAADAGGGPLSRSPRRAVAIVAGAILAMAAIGFGVIQLTGGDDGATPKKSPGGSANSTKPETPAKGKKRKGSGIDPSKVRVAVLNGTTVPGLAANIGDQIEKQGFQLGTVTNFVDQQRAESVVLFAPGAEREAADVGKRLKIAQREPVDAESQSVAGDATVVVVTGADKTQ